jgi:hypothetical protein
MKHIDINVACRPGLGAFFENPVIICIEVDSVEPVPFLKESVPEPAFAGMRVVEAPYFLSLLMRVLVTVAVPNVEVLVPEVYVQFLLADVCVF